MNELYLSATVSDSITADITLESLIIISIHYHCNCDVFHINFVLQERTENVPTFKIKKDNSFNFVKHNELPGNVKNCTFPVAFIENVRVVSGLCSVARQILLSLDKQNVSRKLLGFRDSCLAACNETSIWTKFCEIDIIATTKDISLNIFPDSGEEIKIPNDLTRFENHMSQPVRIHNINKIIQNNVKQQNMEMFDNRSESNGDCLDLKHSYSEGPFLTLADVILFPNIHIALNVYGLDMIKRHLPHTYKWYNNMKVVLKTFEFEVPKTLSNLTGKTVLEDGFEIKSLCILVPQKYKSRNRVFTRQSDVTRVLSILDTLPTEITFRPNPSRVTKIDFNWLDFPPDAKPQGGALPPSRMKRKSEQLENIANIVMEMAKPGETIVDFCSGSGHLGILLAFKLPQCQIILLDNKEWAICRAKVRVEKLKLKNVTLLQCNLDYFVGNFDIGVSLHACGVATDLVIQHCLRHNAAFVTCPCCYGGVHDCHHITYPRSELLRKSLTPHEYLVLGHAADQTHDSANLKTKQGVHCMNIIDTDRKLQAEEHNYKVTLWKMVPESCTPKNNILVGLPNL